MLVVLLCGCGAPSFLRPSSTVGSQIRVRELKQDWIKIFLMQAMLHARANKSFPLTGCVEDLS